MSNPFEFFNTSDDEDNKVTIVKKDDKHKVSTLFSIQPTQKNVHSKNKKKKVIKKQLKLPDLLLLKMLFHLKLRKAIKFLIIRNVRKNNGNKKKSPAVILMTGDPELAESNDLVIQRQTQKSRRRIWQCWKRQGPPTARKVR